jgi:hypothetical protein
MPENLFRWEAITFVAATQTTPVAAKARMRMSVPVEGRAGVQWFPVNCNSWFASKFEEPFDKLKVNGQGTSRSWCGSRTMNDKRYVAVTDR